MKIYKGYQVAGNCDATSPVFEVTEIYKTTREFLKAESNFSEYLEDNGIKFQGTKAEKEALLQEYNRDDELKLFYSFENIDNVKEELSNYECESIEELKAKFEEIESLN